MSHQTLPGGPSPLLHSQNHTGSNYSIQSQISRSSETTQGTTQSTLFPPPSGAHAAAAAQPSANGSAVVGDVVATDNVMNSVADASSSLFQICVSLRQRLLGVPGVNQSLADEENRADADTDPVTLLWRTFRQGVPLMQLYNALNPKTPLTLGSNLRDDKIGKAATFKFLQACVNELKFPQEECFIVTDLYGDDTTGFVKVARVVNRVLDILVQRGLIEDRRSTASDLEQAEKGLKKSQRQHIVAELVSTERTYVQHLELLQSFKNLVEEKGVIPGDAVHDMFLNLNALLDIQRRFLIRVEQTNALPEDEQNWGKLFILYCDAFQVYEPYIANQKKCEQTVLAEFAKLKEAGGSVEMRQMVESPVALYGFLMKPLQRLTKYPLLLNDLYKKGDLDAERKRDLMVGKEAATSVLDRTNRAVDRQEKAEAVEELKMRLEDWKGHRVEGFGELLLHGMVAVHKSDNEGAQKEAERQYQVYLFESIMLYCKEVDLSKPKNKITTKQLVDKRGKPKLQLKGRIFMKNVTDLITLIKPGSYKCQIFWKGDPAIENFIIRFKTEEEMNKWLTQIENQRRRRSVGHGSTKSSESRRSGGTSQTDFVFMQNQPPLQNPYLQQGDDDDDDDLDFATTNGAPVWSGSYRHSREASQGRPDNPNQRSKASTGEISATQALGARGLPSLASGYASTNLPNIRTQQLQQRPPAASPVDWVGDSYFSPTADSPLSTRTSSSSGMYHFSRQPLPQNAYFEEGHGNTRFTAPAVARHADTGHPPPSARQPSMPRPGISAVAGLHSAQQMPPRNRSASSPNIHHAQGVRSNGLTGRIGGEQPPVPEMPLPYQQQSHVVPRSHTNSPNPALGVISSRTMSNSPQLARDKTYQARPQQDPSPTSSSRPGLPADPRDGYYPHSRVMTPVPGSRNGSFSPAPLQPGAASSTSEGVTQIRVKVRCPAASQVMTLVVSSNISYETLRDRIDAKLQRSTHLSLADRGSRETQVKLKYLDEEDYVSIQSDEDVQTAFETWREQTGGTGELELFCQR
ncbi:hypothetical protein K470DRAFT_216659 [Piedraia hortae CBS 480.64]|uniref:DH domain-containing protein n=1 Tax=Piedraia hortae CBS 480.64 TaxID=1314780 RepID=A0A6A7C118_9PEZI|nr:hypothetical protein K470DRAFT_216659 [Piedraia hortae CBS 480.64]